ncbi:MAG: hypothetical protein J6U53_02775 [Tidjanibacter sp.]|nr:hypothetical protein [Tidjanibacter sp.]
MKIKSIIVAATALFVSAVAFAQDPVTEVNKMWNEAVPLLNAKNYAEALPILEKTLEAAFEADAMDVVEKVQKYIPVCYFQNGLSCIKAGDTDAALVNLYKADEVAKLYNDAKTSRNAKSAISRVYKMLGAKSFNSKDYAAAVEVFAKGYEANPQDTDLALNLAMSYCELKDFENGVKVYTDVIALEKRHSKFVEPANKAKEALSNYLLVKAQDEFTAGDKEAAYATLDILINADPMNSANQMYRLQKAAELQDWDNVITWAELAGAVMVTPEQQSEVYYLVAVAYDSKNENQLAVDNYNLVVAGDKLQPAQARAAELVAFIKAEAEAAK